MISFFLPGISDGQVNCPHYNIVLGSATIECEKMTIPVYVDWSTSAKINEISMNIFIFPNPPNQNMLFGFDEVAIRASVYPDLASKTWYNLDFYSPPGYGRMNFWGFTDCMAEDIATFMVTPTQYRMHFCDLVFKTDVPVIIKFDNLIQGGNIPPPKFRLECGSNLCPFVSPDNIYNPPISYNPQQLFHVVGDNIQKLPANCSGGGSGLIADVQITHTGTGNTFFTSSNSNGEWCKYFSQMEEANVTVNRNTDFLCGLSTADIVKIQKHILGIDILSEGWQYIAADANLNKSITAADMSDIRKYFLGVTIPPSSRHNWFFVPQSGYQSLSNPEDALQLPEFIQQVTTPSNKFTFDFYGVKVGDVNGSCNSCLYTVNKPSVSVNRIRESANSNIIIGNANVNFPNEIPIDLKTDMASLAFEFTLESKVGLIYEFVPNADLTESELGFKISDSGNKIHIIVNLLSNLDRFKDIGKNIGILKCSRNRMAFELNSIDENKVYGIDGLGSELTLLTQNPILNSASGFIGDYYTNHDEVIINLKHAMDNMIIDVLDINGNKIYSKTYSSLLTKQCIIKHTVLQRGINLIRLNSGKESQIIKIFN